MITLALLVLTVIFAAKNLWVAMAICLTLLVIIELLAAMKD